MFKYSNTNKRYHTLDYFYKNKFKNKVCKVSLNGGFSCPNKDGKLSTKGCIYCSPLGSGDFAGDVCEPLKTQFNTISKRMQQKWSDAKFIGYFQANTNTYAPLSELKEKYEKVLKMNVIGLTIATRPDCITDECLDYLSQLNNRTYLTVELGLQTIHKKTTEFINRCHTLECFENMVKKLREKNINVVAHIINGLPFETKEMMIETVDYLNKLDIQGIKIHMLHIIKNTRLADFYNTTPFNVLTLDEYTDIVCTQLRHIRPEIVIHRITGDPDKEQLIAPTWLLKKFNVLNSIDKKMVSLNAYQGDLNNPF